MEEKKKNMDGIEDKDADVAVILLFLLALAGIAVELFLGKQITHTITPFAFPFIAIFCLIIYMSNIKNGFKLSNVEKATKNDAMIKCKQALDKISELQQIIKDNDLKYTKNGRLDQRGYLARDVQVAMDDAKAILAKYKPVYDKLKSLPWKRFDEARYYFSFCWSYFSTFAVWLAIRLLYPSNIKWWLAIIIIIIPFVVSFATSYAYFTKKYSNRTK